MESTRSTEESRIGGGVEELRRLPGSPGSARAQHWAANLRHRSTRIGLDENDPLRSPQRWHVDRGPETALRVCLPFEQLDGLARGAHELHAYQCSRRRLRPAGFQGGGQLHGHGGGLEEADLAEDLENETSRQTRKRIAHHLVEAPARDDVVAEGLGSLWIVSAVADVADGPPVLLVHPADDLRLAVALFGDIGVGAATRVENLSLGIDERLDERIPPSLVLRLDVVDAAGVFHIGVVAGYHAVESRQTPRTRQDCGTARGGACVRPPR